MLIMLKLIKILFDLNLKRKMNKTANDSINFYELLLQNSISSRFKDSFFLFLIVPLCILGFFLNGISLIIFFKKAFDNLSLFQYLKVYTANSLILILLGIFTPNYFSFSYNVRIFKCLIISSFSPMLYCFGYTLDTFINIERALCYSKKFAKFKLLTPYKVCLIAFILVLLINLPTFFIYGITDDKDLTKELCYRTEFSLSSFGKIILVMAFILQGPLLLAAVIASNLFSILSFRDFIKKKSLNLNSNTNLNEIQLKRLRKIETYERNLLFMTVYLTGFSFLSHIFQFISQIMLYIFTSIDIFAYFEFCFLFVALLKHTVNFVFYFCFNKKFRKYFKSANI